MPNHRSPYDVFFVVQQRSLMIRHFTKSSWQFSILFLAQSEKPCKMCCEGLGFSKDLQKISHRQMTLFFSYSQHPTFLVVLIYRLMWLPICRGAQLFLPLLYIHSSGGFRFRFTVKERSVMGEKSFFAPLSCNCNRSTSSLLHR